MANRPSKIERSRWTARWLSWQQPSPSNVSHRPVSASHEPSEPWSWGQGCFWSRELYPKWGSRLAGADTYLKDNCWAMLESLGVEFPEQRLSTDEKQK
jgi:hypothetical protein